MKDTFKEYLTPSVEEKKAIWENATIVFDTNILFNLYRYSVNTRDNLLALMETYRDQLWLPYQVGYEFFNKRLEIIDKVTRAHDELKKKIDTFKNPLTEFFNKEYAHHPLIRRDDFFSSYDEAINRVKDKLDEWMKSMPSYQENDIILDKLLELYEGRLGADYPLEKLQKVYKEAEKHYNEKTPPGYKDWKDKEKDGWRHQAGDLIIWNQTMDYAISNKTNIIFVTEDLKEDWWNIKDGEIISPRVELIREFRNTTGRDILMYRQNGFLNDAVADVKETTKEEVKIISQEDKEAYTRAALQQVIEDMQKKVEPSSYYPYTDLSRMIANPLREIINSENSLQNRLANPLNMTMADIIAAQQRLPNAEQMAQRLALGSLSTSMPSITDLLARKDNKNN